ncbi:MAG: hemolysin III family protein [Planctomycetota bacterium]
MWLPADPVAAFTHLTGALVCVAVGPALFAKGRTLSDRVALGIFATSAVLLLLASGTFHSMDPDTTSREVFRRLDHAAIFVLIAGSFTPVHVILFRGWRCWGVLIPIWAAAIGGVAVKTVFFESIPYWVGIIVYLLMGWTGGVSFAFVIARYGFRFASPLLIGGIAYTVGAICEFTGEPDLIPGVFASHEVFHVLVLMGLMGMWAFMSRSAEFQSPDPSDGPPITRENPERGYAPSN